MANTEPNRTRKKQIIIRFTEEEYKIFKTKKEKSTYNSYAEFIFRAIYNVPIYTIDVKPILKLLTELNRIGTNINQIAKVTNETRNIYENDVIDLKNKVDKIAEMTSATLAYVMKHKNNDLLKNL